MRALTKGRDVLLVFEEDVEAALTKALSWTVIMMWSILYVLRRPCAAKLRALVSMVLEEGPSMKDQMADTTSAALANAQMLKFNCIKDNRAHPTTGLVTARHSAVQETPVPTYVEMMLHAHTRKRELVDRLSHLGISISYTRVIELSAQMWNSACQ